MPLVIQSHNHHHHAMDQPSPYTSSSLYNSLQPQPTTSHSSESTSNNALHSFDYSQRPHTFPPPPSGTVSTTNPHAIAIDLSPNQFPLSSATTATNESHSPIPLPAAPTHSSNTAAATAPLPSSSQPTLCPICTTLIQPAHLADHLRLERKQLAGEPLTPSDRLALQQHGVRLPPAAAPAATTRASRRSNALSSAAATPAKAKAKAAAASANVASTALGQYKLLVEGVATRRRTRAAAAAESGTASGYATPARAAVSSRHASSLPTSPAPSSSRARRPPAPPTSSSSARKRQASRTSSSASAAMLVDPETDDWSPAASADIGSVVCPICAQFIVGDELAVNAHIDACLANPMLARVPPASASGAISVDTDASGSDDDGASTDDDPAMYEPLPVAPPRPLPRAPAAAPAASAPASAVHSPPSRSMSAAGRGSDSDSDSDDELDVDIDADTSASRAAAFGTAQFTELDVLPYSVAIHGANDLALQSLVAATPGEDADAVRKRILDQAEAVAKRVQCELPMPAAAAAAGMSAAERADAVTLEALKERVAHLERLTQETPRCKVCWEGLGGKAGAPVVSVACWHVHCQECWLQSLGYRKVCPQCLVITRPEDLRKVYI